MEGCLQCVFRVRPVFRLFLTSFIAFRIDNNSVSGSRYSKDDDHIAQINDLLGEIPKTIAAPANIPMSSSIARLQFQHLNSIAEWEQGEAGLVREERVGQQSQK